MSIEKTPNAIVCDYCNNTDYYFGNKKCIVEQAIKNGWVIYKGKHFDTKECLNAYLHSIRI